MSSVNEIIKAVEQAPTSDFVELLRIAELDPAKDIRFLNLKGINFSGNSLAGFDFSGALISGCNFTGTYIAEADFDDQQLSMPELKSALDYHEFLNRNKQRLLRPEEVRIRKQLTSAFTAMIDDFRPDIILPPHLPKEPKGKTVLIAVGRQALTMAKAVDENWSGPLTGAILTHDGQSESNSKFEMLEAAYPVPDENTAKNVNRIHELVSNLSKNDLVLLLLSAGAEGFMAAPLGDMSQQELNSIHMQLLRAGVSNDERNMVRRHLSRLGAGRLAKAAFPAKITTLDIIDGPSDIALGFGGAPTIPDDYTGKDAIDILQKYSIDSTPAVHAALTDDRWTVPEPDHPCFNQSELQVLGSWDMILDVLTQSEQYQDLEVINLGALDGEAKQVGLTMADQCRALTSGKHGKVSLLLSGGELTTTVQGTGTGGPNMEFLLSLAIGLNGLANVTALAIDTGGMDGGTNAAGAFINPTTLVRAAALSIDPQTYLQNNDSYNFFEQLGDLFITGPTDISMGDLRAVLIEPPS